jgi:hypothetical protein
LIGSDDFLRDSGLGLRSILKATDIMFVPKPRRIRELLSLGTIVDELLHVRY